MILNFELIIGIEVHVVLNTKTKMFSPSKNSHNDLPNNNICPIDLGLPGILPSPNIECIKKAIVLANALNMEISNKIVFDRKNYFYPDLPKGFQITQQFFPIGKNGQVAININDKIKNIEIERIHLEEDTAKQIEINNQILLDYNRSGLPLIEIVSKPNIYSPSEASLYLKKLKKILMFNNISDAKLEDGSMRADVNISIRPHGEKKYGTRVEIKNINSISNVEKAIIYEFERQQKLLLSGEKVQQETRKFNDKNNTTEFLRLKTNVIEYRYMLEPNIFERSISNDFIKNVIQKNYFNLEEVESKFINANISQEYINLIFDDLNSYKAFNIVNEIANDTNETVKWLFIEALGLIFQDNKNISDISIIQLQEIGNLILYLKKDIINGKQGKEILKNIFKLNISIDEIIKKFNLKQINDKDELHKMLTQIVTNNLNMLEQYNSRKERVEKFFLGLLMKETNGQANPKIANDILLQVIKTNIKNT